MPESWEKISPALAFYLLVSCVSSGIGNPKSESVRILFKMHSTQKTEVQYSYSVSLLSTR
jgi:hypothetical protein